MAEAQALTQGQKGKESGCQLGCVTYVVRLVLRERREPSASVTLMP